ncbi:MAG: bifunctional phosphoglucose/phosphomannose isomerase [Nitrososphaerota archaeon]|nr:bifunctional phosphoglucose/phosphomannose isomerase [Nitrososphaerota archaeon]
MDKPLLDDQEKIRTIDKNGMIDFCINAATHYRNAAKIAQHPFNQISTQLPERIIIAGMGGSAIGGELIKDWARDKLSLPIEVNREYSLPAYADQKTLVLVSSYSGDTEESLSTLLDALKRGCMLFCVTSNGAVLETAKKHNLPHIQVPPDMPPRAALPYLLIPMLIYLQKIGLAKNVEDELDEAYALIEKVSKENGLDTPMVENFAKNTAYYIGDSIPCVYGFGVYRSVAQRFKQQLNENSKSVAKWEYFPELNHNELVGWESRGEQCRWVSVIFIRDKAEPAEIETRIDITKTLMERAGLITFELEVQGECTLAKMLSTVVVGDFLSIYLAVLRETDPTPVLTINYLKETLKTNGIKNRILTNLKDL